jgi:hypothetical protein
MFCGPSALKTACPSGGTWTDAFPAVKDQHLEGVLGNALSKSSKTDIAENIVLKEVSVKMWLFRLKCLILG